MRSLGWILPLLVWACGPSTSEVDPIPADVTLARIESCEALETYLEDRAVDALEDAIARRLDDGFVSDPLPPNVAPETPRLLGDSPFERAVIDGERLHFLDDGQLRTVSIDPLIQERSLAIEGTPLGIAIAGERLFVLSRLVERLRVTTVSRAELTVLGTLDLAGEISAATVGPDGLLLALHGGLSLPEELEVLEQESEVKSPAFRSSEESAIRARTLDDWLPLDDLGRDCTSYYYPPEAPLHLGLSRSIAIGDQVTSIAFLGESRFALSARALLAIAPHRWSLPRPGQVEHAYLFSFAPDTLEPLAAGGMDGVPATAGAIAFGDSILAVTAIDRRLSDPINAWGRVSREHRVQELSLQDLTVLAESEPFALEEQLRAIRFLGSQVFVSSAAALHHIHGAGVATYPAARPIDRIALAPGVLITAGMRERQLDLEVLDRSDPGRLLAARTIAVDLPGVELGFSVDSERGAIAIPELGTADFEAPAPVALRVLSLGAGGQLTTEASLDLSLLAGQAAAPRLLYGLFAGPYALLVSDAGVARLAGANTAAALNLTFE
jgi:hypothetical protein